MMVLISQRVLIPLHILALAVSYTDCETYHIAFLGRNQTLSAAPIGSIVGHSDTSTPNVYISSAVGTCTSNITSLPESILNSVEVVFNGYGCPLLVPFGNEKSKKGIKIEFDVSDMVVHVSQNDGSASAQAAEGYLAIPDHYLGNEYYVVTYCSVGGVCQFAVTGVTNETQVYIIFPENATVSTTCNDVTDLPDSAPPGSPARFVIDEFDVLHFESEVDLTGTYIWSDYNVVVISGARDVPTSTGSPTATSHMIEQLPPVNRWGTEFVASPNYLNDAGDILKIVAKDDSTKVHISGFSPLEIPQRGGFIEKRIDWQMHSRIEASNPVLVVQVMSLDLYNTTAAVTGTPAMVLVPHIDQWMTLTESPFYCDQFAQNQTIVSVVADTSDIPFVPVLPYPSVYYSPWTEVEGSSYSVQMFEPLPPDFKVAGPTYTSYGFCNGNIALLLRANWTSENEGCVQTTPTAGDDVDNDCDGQIDEDDCKGQDLTVIFSSQQNASGDVAYKALTIRGAGYVRLKIQTCSVAMVTLQANQYDPVQRTNIQITPTSVSAEYCTDSCSSALTANISVSNCRDMQSYLLQWSVSSWQLTHTFTWGSEAFTWSIPYSGIDDYDQMFLYALAGSAEFDVGLLEKDCKKVPRVSADRHGSNFLVPVHNTDTGFTVIMSASPNLSNTTTVTLNIANTVGSVDIEPGDVKMFTQSAITENDYDRVPLTVSGGEISVFLIRSTTSIKSMETPLMPNDVLGPSYHTFKHSDTEETLTGSHCDVYSALRIAHTNIGTIPLGVNTEINNATYGDPDTSLRIESDRPLAVYCGTFTDTMHQIPPIETLGIQHYIPALNFTQLAASAEVLVIATEDSTVVTIRGDYDNLDTIDLAGNYVTRTITDGKIYNITATKPVQVHLQVRGSDWASAIIIPPVQQYKTEHIFPGQFYGFVDIVNSSAVDAVGSAISSLVATSGESTQAYSHVYSNATFSLTVVKYIGLGTDKYFIIPSDVLYDDINEVCKLTNGYPGDGIDNDCDGLIDQEQCSDSATPGNIDFDIDGSLNEDCAYGTNKPQTVPTLSIPPSMVTCTVAGSGENTTSVDSVEIIGTNITDDSGALDPSQTPTTPPVDNSEPFESFTIHLPSVLVPVQTSEDGTTEAPETCHQECMCPCGWLYPQNYTQEEIAASVVEIQKKLEVNKEELSAVARKKTSATDERTSATAVGLVGLVFMVTTIGTIAFLDIATLFRDIAMLSSRMKSIFSS